MGDLTEHFSRSEFACKCGCGLDNIDMEAVRALQSARYLIGVPVIVHRGCSCAAHNAAVGGAPASMHLPQEDGFCKAVDSHAQGKTIRQWFDALNQQPIFMRGGLEINVHPDGTPGWMHSDIRPNGPWRDTVVIPFPTHYPTGQERGAV